MNQSNNPHLVMHALIRAAFVGILLAAVVWLILPGGGAEEPFDLERALKVESTEQDETQEEVSQLSSAMFDKQLWYTPPRESKSNARKPEPQSSPMKFQLMAITGSDSEPSELGRTAVIYDPDADLVYQVRAGERAGQFMIRSISDRAVELVHGQRIARLSLEIMEELP